MFLPYKTIAIISDWINILTNLIDPINKNASSHIILLSKIEENKNYRK